MAFSNSLSKVGLLSPCHYPFNSVILLLALAICPLGVDPSTKSPEGSQDKWEIFIFDYSLRTKSRLVKRQQEQEERERGMAEEVQASVDS